MMRGMYAAVSGLEAHQTMLDVTANNLANVDTIGYKTQRTTFEDELSQTMAGASAPGPNNGGSNAEQVGLGVQVGSIDNLMGQGSAQTTGNPLDVAIQGDGFLQVASSKAGTDPTNVGVAALQTPDYTRAGNLRLNPNGYLTTQSGQYVIGASAAGTGTGTQTTIKIPANSTNVAIGKDGAVTYTDTSGATQTAGFLQIATFPNQAGLTRDGGSNWSASESSGAAQLGTPGSQGFGQSIAGELEQSNVDMATEFTNMITAERGYQANSKAITTADTMLQTVVNMVQG